MTASRNAALAILWVLSAGVAVAAERPKREFFFYDAADETVPATVFDNPNYYDADIARVGDDLWVTWLEFFPGQGDHVWVARYVNHQLELKRLVSPEPGEYANPTITPASEGRLWLSYEAQMDGQWEVLLAQVNPGNSLFRGTVNVSTSPGPDIRHRTAATPDGGLWIVWQGERNGQFDVLARQVSPKGGLAEIQVLSDASTLGDWHPDVALAPDGTVYVVWDGYDGTSYDVYARSCQGGAWRDIVVIAASPAFEGRAQVAAGTDGRVWVLWEEGADNWGKTYFSRMRLKGKHYFEMSDTCGPLHRFRRLRLGLLDQAGGFAHLKAPLPMPSIEQALTRPDAAEAGKALGAFYERGRLIIDDSGRVWILYRHYYVPWLGIERITHQEAGWGVYARCLQGDGFSKLYRFQVGQGDGLQSLGATPYGNGVAVAWTTGRTDRRMTDVLRGVVVATLAAPGSGPAAVKTAPPADKPIAAAPPEPPVPPEAATVAGKRYELFFGDLHRHTDLSLCFVPSDGTIDDAYRYAIDVAGLDFLGITDHCRDLARGNALSQLWWRCRKQVSRHDLKPRFIPFFSYERSRGGEDHNVVSLRPDMLRPHTYPHPQLWKELDDDTITIPHQTITDPIEDPANPPRSLQTETWDAHDNARRPLLEIYQGCRDRSIERDAHEGLARRYLFGFIASSDHCSTSGSYAGVWAEERTRESIFRAMQARRTFGAMDKIRLIVRAGDHWMGEHFTAPCFPPIHIEAGGTAPISSIEIVIDGEVKARLPQTGRRITLTYEPEIASEGFHYLYVRLHQTDGSRAWSSPIWVESLPTSGP